MSAPDLCAQLGHYFRSFDSTKSTNDCAKDILPMLRQYPFTSKQVDLSRSSSEELTSNRQPMRHLAEEDAQNTRCWRRQHLSYASHGKEDASRHSLGSSKNIANHF
ncbi:hypothetical protein PoB_005558800 [Plakobranchus ocellatus]|uniref:Uncharacterized protein n=1 Tax=Plakobranchus ocellatus TaxID=259542 RepID=A0AAV4CDP2_9GAST|nr:hypothetical protein PoB_005558800 [Plakobranchus ocellatus]